MIDAAVAKVPVAWRADIVIGILIVFAAVIGYTTRTFQAERTVTQTVHVVRAPGSGSALAAAWGKPDTIVDGQQINPQLAGTRCAVYQSRRAVLCYA